MQYQRADLAYFPYQIEYALNNYRPHSHKAYQFRNIIIGGLGGSGIAGHFVKHFSYDKASLPIEVISEYTLPCYAGEETLLLLSSYSGNTEETLALAEEGKQKGATIMVITTGGKLAAMAEENRWPIFYAEPGFQPRMALGYSLTYLLLILNDCFDLDLSGMIRNISEDTRDTESIITKAEGYFSHFSSQVDQKFIALTDLYSYPTGLRFCQQMQENAKTEAFVHRVPESNHNVIESYYGDLNSVFILLNTGANARVNLRFQFIKTLLEQNGNLVIEVPIKDASLRSLLYTTFLLDWIALMAADKKGINSLEIPNIEALKNSLKNA